MLCANCEKAIQAAFTWSIRTELQSRKNDLGSVVHSTYPSFLGSVIGGCTLCRYLWKRAVDSYHYWQCSLEDHDYIPQDFTQLQGHLPLMRRLLENWDSSNKPSGCPLPLGPTSHKLLVEGCKYAAESLLQLLERLDGITASVESLPPCSTMINWAGDWEGTGAVFLVCKVEKLSFAPYRSIEMVIRRRSPLLQGLLPICTTFQFDLMTFIPPAIDASLSRNGCTGQSSSTCTSDGPSLWRYWASLCSESHLECNQYTSREGFSPERLIEITSDAITGKAALWKLVTNLDKCHYMTLSHCWGSIQHTELTTSTLDRFPTDSSVSELPKTYQDAMNVSLAMGCRHIWIDSLCIVQDDLEDWKQQSSMMGLIYKHAACNIAATCAKDGNGGCFNQRDPADIDPWTIKLPIRSAQVPDSAGRTDFRIIPNFDHYDAVNGAVLNSRGWVVQERYLSPRQLQFTKDEVCWECSELVASERFPTGIPDYMYRRILGSSPGQGKPRLNHGSQYDLRQSWASLVNLYSKTKLSVFTDRPAAIAGLAGELRERLGDEYLAGLWGKDLIKQLCWRAEHIGLTARRHSRLTGVYLAPTWSWISIDGEICYDENYWDAELKETVLYLAQVIAISVRSSHSARLHSFEAGSLQIRALGMWCRVVVRGQVGDERAREELVEASHPDRKSAGSPLARFLLGDRPELLWDERIRMPHSPDQDPEQMEVAEIKLKEMRQSDLLFIFVSWDGWRPKPISFLDDTTRKGLILAQTSDSDSESEKFVRLGGFQFRRVGSEKYVEDELGEVIRSRLGLGVVSESEVTASLPESFDLGDSRLADLVHIVTIF